MNYWLFKSEPDEYSIDHLKKDKTCIWEGVRNYQARNIMRDKCRKGDLVLFYHSSTKDTGIYGTAKITKTGVADPTQFNKKSNYYDPKSTKESPRWICVEIKFVSLFKEPVLRSRLKELSFFDDMYLLKKGSRLSVQPVEKKYFDKILGFGG